MKFLFTIIFITINLLTFYTASAQQDFISEDYKTFGRKEPISLGSLFGALGTSTILVNPANIASVTDNRIYFGGGGSNIGNGTFISWMAPNLSISSSTQIVDENDTTAIDYEKQLLHFCFGISTKDLGYASEKGSIAIGLAVKRQADWLIDTDIDADDEKIAGGNAVSLDLGLLLKWKLIALEIAMINFNNPKLSDSNISYSRSFIFGGRLTTPAGLTIALQGIGGNTYAGSDFGLNIAAEQSFLEHRLISRLQLTSFFKGSEAMMQNINCGIGYRIDPEYNLITLLKDLEFSYTLSFLALPKNVGTHLVVITKYF